MKRLMICSVLLLSGCTLFDTPTPPPDKKEVTIRMQIRDDMPDNLFGQAVVVGDYCFVEINRKSYPFCITHEVMHCFGWVHDNKPNSENCHK